MRSLWEQWLTISFWISLGKSTRLRIGVGGDVSVIVEAMLRRARSKATETGDEGCENAKMQVDICDTANEALAQHGMLLCF